MRAALLAVLVVLLAGCLRGGDDPVVRPGGSPTPPTPVGPPLVFGGLALDAVTGEPLANATVRLDLARSQPCQRQGIGWASWESVADADGRWGPIEAPRPRSDDVAFFLHVRAEGYSENTTFLGPEESKADIGNMSVVLHPDADVVGTAPPGTLVALDAEGFPRMVLSAPNGTFAFRHARVVDAVLVVGTSVPQHRLVRAPANVTIEDTQERGWTLEGVVRSPTGAPLPADVVARRDGSLYSLGRSGDNGVFTLPLPQEPARIVIEARTRDDAFGGTLVFDVNGPPALRQTLVTDARC